jgi:hypothetical protein
MFKNFKKLGIVLFLLVCVAGFSLSSVSAGTLHAHTHTKLVSNVLVKDMSNGEILFNKDMWMVNGKHDRDYDIPSSSTLHELMITFKFYASNSLKRGGSQYSDCIWEAPHTVIINCYNGVGDIDLTFDGDYHWRHPVSWMTYVYGTYKSETGYYEVTKKYAQDRKSFFGFTFEQQPFIRTVPSVPTTTELAPKTSTFVQGSNGNTLVSRLLDNKGNPIVGAVVVFFIQEEKDPIFGYSNFYYNKTNENGIAVCNLDPKSIPLSRKGNYSILSIFDGDEIYARSTCQGRITVV